MDCANCGHEVESFSDELLEYEHSFFHLEGNHVPVEKCFCGCVRPEAKKEGN